MASLSYSTFMNLLIEHSLTIDKEDLARGILESFVDDSVSEAFDSPYLSKIFTGTRELVSKIKDNIAIVKKRKACIEHFEDFVFPGINPEQLDDFIEKLINLINNDESIAESKRKKLLETNVPGAEAKFIANVFIYAINKPNKKPIENLELCDIDLFDEVDQECPLCNTPLYSFNKSKTKTIYRFSITKIFPEGLSQEKYNEFNALYAAPIDLNDSKNKICLCDNCSEEYIFTPSIDTYDKLYRFKGRALKSKGLKKTTGSTQLDEEITAILGNIKECDIDADSFKELRMKPLKVVKKIKPENRLLIKDINDDNGTYYNYIKEVLSNQDEHKKSFRKIALEVNKCFLDLDDETDSQDDIYNALVQWILDSQRLPESYRAAAHIVISFFVQNCEVFDEITE